MKTPNWKDEVICIKEGFKVVLSFAEDFEDAKHHFVSTCGWSESQYAEINHNYWFTAEVKAYKGKTLCATTYLGACCYASKKEVMAGGEVESILGGYMPQMIDEVVEEAQVELAQLIDATKAQLEELVA